MKNIILIILLSQSLFFTTLNSSHTQNVQINNSPSHIVTANNYPSCDIQIHVPAPSSDDYDYNP